MPHLNASCVPTVARECPLSECKRDENVCPEIKKMISKIRTNFFDKIT